MMSRNAALVTALKKKQPDFGDCPNALDEAGHQSYF